MPGFFTLLLNFLLSTALFATSWGALGYLVFGPQGFLVAVTGCVLMAFAGLVYCETGFLRGFHGLRDAPAGLLRLLPEGLPAPRIRMVSDTLPLFFLTRGLGRKGTVVLSQGLIAVLSEEQLRQLLAFSCQNAYRFQTVPQSFFAWLGRLFEHFLPGNKKGTAGTLFLAALVLPLLHYAQGLGKGANLLRAESVSYDALRQVAWINRVHG